jgi:hypothetical protein
VTKVQVRRGRVQTQLDPQRLTAGLRADDLAQEVLLDEQFVTASLGDVEAVSIWGSDVRQVRTFTASDIENSSINIADCVGDCLCDGVVCTSREKSSSSCE